MKIFLTSFLHCYTKDENEKRIPNKLEDTNAILTNIKSNLLEYKKIVFVANNPQEIQETKEKAEVYFESLKLSGLDFKDKIILDMQNFLQAKAICEDADLIILSGGKCLCQNQFFQKINLKEILKKFNGVVIGISAGSMNLCKTVANFPEEKIDFNEPRWLEGLGFFDKIIIPHFDGKTRSYQNDCQEINIVNDFILSMSKDKKFVGIENEAYILIDKKVEFFGNCCIIENGKIKSIKGIL